MGLLFESLSNFENENEKLKYLYEQAQASSKFFSQEYTRLRAENKKLREALEFYSKCDGFCADDECVCSTKIATEALK